MFNRLWNSRKYIRKTSFSATALIYALLGFVRTFVSFEGFYESDIPVWNRVLVSVLIFLVVWFVCVLGVSINVLCTRERKVIEGRNGKAVYVKYGDLFNEKILGKSEGRRNICFAVNRCFDTVVDNRLITEISVHGIALKRVYKDGLFDPGSMNTAIQAAISPSAQSEQLTKEQKPEGNLKRYEVGTGADVTISNSLHYFMIAIGRMDSNLTNSAKDGEYCLAIQGMIEFIDAYSQGFPVLLPIIGAGLTRISQDEPALLKYIVECLRMNKAHVNTDVYIIVKEDAKERISILDL